MVLVLLAIALSTPFAGGQDFKLINHSQHDIDELHLSPTTDDSWGPDILGVDILKDGASTEIEFSDYTECKWDLKLVQSNSEGESPSVWVIDNVDLCNVLEMELTWNGRKVAYSTKKVIDDE
jgi:hypothetical protein